MTVIEPVANRAPFFDGGETNNVKYVFSCPSCGTESIVVFKDMLQAAWGWREKTERNLRLSIACHFGINLNNNSIGSGMDAVVVSQCSKCSEQTFIYFWFHEYRNSCYRISLRGLAFNNS